MPEGCFAQDLSRLGLRWQGRVHIYKMNCCATSASYVLEANILQRPADPREEKYLDVC